MMAGDVLDAEMAVKRGRHQDFRQRALEAVRLMHHFVGVGDADPARHEPGADGGRQKLVFAQAVRACRPR